MTIHINPNPNYRSLRISIDDIIFIHNNLVAYCLHRFKPSFTGPIRETYVSKFKSIEHYAVGDIKGVIADCATLFYFDEYFPDLTPEEVNIYLTFI